MNDRLTIMINNLQIIQQLLNKETDEEIESDLIN
jgi:hypothetical protein